MHPSVIDFLQNYLTPAEISGKDVLEVGSYNVNGTPRSVIEPLKPASYVGVDAQHGPCVDRIVPVDALVASFGEDRFDVVVSTEMLEHVRDWRSAVTQMKSVVRPGGLLVITTRSPGFPYHAYPEDHWRFTMSDFYAIFKDMKIDTLIPDVPNMPGVLLKAAKITAVQAADLTNVNPAGPH